MIPKKIFGSILAFILISIGSESTAEHVGVRIRLEDTKMSWLVMNEDFTDAMAKVVHYMRDGSDKYRHKELPNPIKFQPPTPGEIEREE